jgi:GDP/UDP-N,N'-diacetylbacillosamine 2-epimerase (hydrolysing)
MKICTVTGSRAEFYILKNLIKKLQKNNFFKHHLVVTGSHNSNIFGNNINKIKKEKINIGSKVICPLKEDKEIDISKSFAVGIRAFAKIFLKIKPDILLILGDRHEIFAAAVAACFNRIPIAHIHGGESTEGAIDEAIRHSITKLSHIHFVTANEYFNRVKQLGENKKNIFNIGSMGVESIHKISLLKKKYIEEKLNIKLNKKNILVTLHPETLKSKNENKNNIKVILNSLKNMKNTTIIFTMPGADANFKIITNEIRKFVTKNSNSYFFKSLGDEIYFSLCNIVDFMLGNSSSGIIEMPSFKKATINVGERQKGRLKPGSVIDVDFNEKEIKGVIKYLYTRQFQKNLKKVTNPYDKGNSSDKLIKILKKIKLKNILSKKFFDYRIIA